ncbi:unnamed protein product [Rangifer tarandus platyrhynchus]|uniref:Uncharacterized protein n=1 Tax=Rangifer tarandus platyrhynchus TaxID=3082113 RepID=A0AC59ZPZ4_RANTA
MKNSKAGDSEKQAEKKTNKDGAGRGRLGSDTPVSPERLPGVITPPPLLSLSDLTLNTGPSISWPQP